MTTAEPNEIRQALLELVEADPPDEERLLARCESHRRLGQPVLSSILYILTHLSFSEPEAERHWERILRHRERLRVKLARDVGLRVALLDYFVNVNRELKNPKVIEISIYESTARSAVTDGLTGLYNHAYFLGALRRETQRSKRYGLKLSLAMLDLDDFKRLNDTRGHLEGDRVLMKAASLLAESLREVDIAARYGGEEFALILPDTPRMAFVVADRIRRCLQDHFRRRRDGVELTLSGGVATYPDDATDVEQLIKRADEGLYRSKADGKNRVTLVGGERRRHPRVNVSHRVTVDAKGRKVAAVRARNLSEGGLLVSAPQPLAVGSALEVTVRPRGGSPVGLRGEVVRVERRGQRGRVHYDLGLRFMPEAGAQPLPLLRRLISAV